VWGLWTAAPMAINQRTLKRIKQNERWSTQPTTSSRYENCKEQKEQKTTQKITFLGAFTKYEHGDILFPIT
jgi:hypothetical protein